MEDASKERMEETSMLMRLPQLSSSTVNDIPQVAGEAARQDMEQYEQALLWRYQRT